MRVIRPGMEGDDVASWETFLRGQGFYWLEVDGKYDEGSVLATKSWQREHSLKDDGVVGPRTFGSAQRLGYDPGFLDGDLGESSPNWPPKPSFSYLSPSARAQVLGHFSFRTAPVAGNPEAIRITDDWVSKNIELVAIPQLAGIEGAPGDGRIHLHRVAAEPFRRFFRAIDEAGFNDRILTFGGSWAPRFIRGSRTVLSNHAYGSAIDINAAWNPLGVTPALKGRRGSVRELVAFANEFGLYWGGHFKRRDGMHFELAKVLT